MSSLLEDIVKKSHQLSSEERAELAHELILSLDNIKDDGYASAWDSEIEKRVRDIENGKTKGRPAEEILAEIRARYS